jgi:hypothetical protein
MAKNKKAKAADDDALNAVTDYRFPEATRKNNPPAKEPCHAVGWFGFLFDARISFVASAKLRSAIFRAFPRSSPGL